MTPIANTIYNWSDEPLYRNNSPPDILKAFGCENPTPSSPELQHVFVSFKVGSGKERPIEVLRLSSNIKWVEFEDHDIFTGSIADWLALMQHNPKLYVSKHVRAYFRDNGLRSIV